jgi:hypothetical protein
VQGRRTDPFDNLEILTRIRNLLEAGFKTETTCDLQKALDEAVEHCSYLEYSNKLLRYKPFDRLASDWCTRIKATYGGCLPRLVSASWLALLSMLSAVI